jgi:hypothetical protein
MSSETISVGASQTAPDDFATLLNGPFDEALAKKFLTALPTFRARDDFLNFVMREIASVNHPNLFWGDGMATVNKSAGFLEDRPFAAAHKVLWENYETNPGWGRQRDAWRLHTLVWAAGQALALADGDFVECGVFRGNMSWFVGEVLELRNTSRTIYLYDSFQGLDPRLEQPGDYFDAGPDFLKEANAHYAVPNLAHTVAERFSGWHNYRVISGFLPASLDHEDAPETVAFLHVDLNSPAAELACYEALYPRLVPGAVIVLDDYGWKTYCRQKETADTFFGSKGLKVLELPTGQGLVVNI